MGLSLEEQEATINIMRTDDICSLYTSDSTWITKLDKLVEKNPEQFKKVKETRWGNTYEFPKRFLSVRTKDKVVEMTDEKREAFVKRMKNTRQD